MSNKKTVIKEVGQLKKDLFREVEKVIIGQTDILERIFISLLAKGHSIIIGVPGLAKTLLIKALARAMDLGFNRVQFTPDLMPSDITGSDIIEEGAKGKRNFKFIQGPVFTNVLLADEINRTPPKTQAALLQSMQEKIVTVNGKTYSLDDPFFVLATQNPIEQEGTYPLPEAQLDRFLFSINIDYPDEKMERVIAKKDTSGYLNKIKKIISKKKILEVQNMINDIPISDFVLDYAVKLVRFTRPEKKNPLSFINEFVQWGAGPRATQFLIHAARVKTILDNRYTVSREDVNFVAYNVLSHRIITNFNAEAEGIRSTDVVDKIIEHLNKKK
ncbi:MAG: MoxR family ATPase [Spirochaetes bacterium]|nr:MoxR family ATPase [Spirochaetota bacterium]